MTALRTAKQKGDFEGLFNLYVEKTQSKLIKDCFHYMRSKHDSSPNPTRIEGTPYWVHPAEVWGYLVDLELAAAHPMQLAALLHDIDEDTDGNLEEIENLFGDEAAHIVCDLSHSTIPNYDSLDREGRREWYWNRIRGSMYETKIVKGLDRHNNLVSLSALLVQDPKRFKKFAYRQVSETEKYLLPILKGNGLIQNRVFYLLLGTCNTLNTMLDSIDPSLGDKA
jgi:(p)ppGpp synthase/HD superfamily hydrolase